MRKVNPINRVIRLPRDLSFLRNGVHTERIPSPHRLRCRAQHIDFFDEEPVPLALGQVDREKPGCTGNMDAAIFGHDEFCWFVPVFPSDAVRSSPHPTWAWNEALGMFRGYPATEQESLVEPNRGYEPCLA